jgi:dihydrolipoamide dehydrogenase
VPTKIVEAQEQCLNKMDPEACEAVGRLMEQRGVELLRGCRLTEMQADADGVRATLENGRTLDAHMALIAVGRRANLDGVGLDAVGLETEDGVIPVDKRCRTRVDGVWAVGDAAERLQYAHLAERMGTVAGENIAGRDLTDDRDVVPIAVYTHPEIAAVGCREQTARELYGNIEILRKPYDRSGTGFVYDEREGQVKVVFQADTGRIVGALWIGPHAVEMIHELVLAMRWGITVEQLYHTIHGHPSFQENLHAAVEEWIAERR